jgi:hypothetical protein
MPEITVEEAVRANCDAIMAKDVMRAAADLTPEAMAGLMAVAMTITQAPELQGYSIESHTESGVDHVFKIRFRTSLGDVVANATWREIAGTWKIAAVSVEGLPSAAS